MLQAINRPFDETNLLAGVVLGLSKCIKSQSEGENFALWCR